MADKERKTKLIEKYEIPLHHLDFAYIRECKNAREMEKIVQILRSGEEGYFPDLTKCAEDKLRELKPNSRLFRYEEKLQGREALSNQDWKPIYEWTNNIKVKDKELSVAEKMVADLDVPPVRKGGPILQSGERADSVSAQSAIDRTKESKTIKKASDRIKSTDYQKWDKYDADEECIRMELAEERVQEEIERKNRLNKQKSKTQRNVEGGRDAKERDVKSKLTAVERESLSEQYRLRGNDYFRAKEYDNAINEYNLSINICPEKAAPAYNNRAAAKIKLKWYSDAIKDCEQCLQLEPDNLKARLRLAEATYCDGERQESYALYLKVLELEPGNAAALRAIAELKSLYGDLPPPTATRLQIQEESKTKSMNDGKVSKKNKKSKIIEKQTTSTTRLVESSVSTPSAALNPLKTKPNDYDLSDLIKPNRLVKNKLATAAAALSNMKTVKTQKQQKGQKDTPKELTAINKQPPKFQTELRLPNDTSTTKRKILIQEI
ncbi:sperm-associated antigen 1 [Rhagoletis pomonella]|uniref:sperm-associated antigen 1 n=1 Tax=Rhagoletis pomonella TaxID=28610 RepID=UPI00177ECFEA|nr:sperm-associated antigen 1 [Rhagoletis pomonella]